MVFRGCLVDLVNPFHTAGLFLYPLKTSENQRFSDIFMGGEGMKRYQWYEWVNMCVCSAKVIISAGSNPYVASEKLKSTIASIRKI